MQAFPHEDRPSIGTEHIAGDDDTLPLGRFLYVVFCLGGMAGWCLLLYYAAHWLLGFN